MEIEYKKSALKYLSRVSPSVREHVRAAVEGLTRTPPEGDVKPMQGYNDGRLRLRVGRDRVIYRIDQRDARRVLIVLDIGPRGDIYK